MSENGFVPLSPGEKVISDSDFERDECAWRNVHPNHHRGDDLTSQVYEPSEDDAGERSTAREKLVTAEGHFNEYTQGGRSSDGVCAVPLSRIQSAGLRWIDDSANVSEVTGHASIDFRLQPAPRSKRSIKKLARELKENASWAHRKTNEQPDGAEG
ncbi:hypothetical protein F8O06_00725 [Pseudoclavibacter sp. CFCC 14310]|uniref:hypothetical protein n=1 Tax=Pseudoclavibacter sp. CFCC 14310 TaxID=2615180 RepID=UPI001300DCA0|nr:hypothetical protein [Pseudoclavibacter sp. CFCC 14310]KAB1647139.1 hypothetical protein F8O06_00725 [Pseudoclavibacter sp. CFCC 14310]